MRHYAKVGTWKCSCTVFKYSTLFFRCIITFKNLRYRVVMEYFITDVGIVFHCSPHNNYEIYNK